jgi:HK97 family phage major capsid protein
MYSDDHLNRLRDERARVFHQMKDIADREMAGESRAEDREAWDRANADLDRLTAEVDRCERANKLDVVEFRRPEYVTERRIETPAGPLSDSDILRQIALGERRDFTFGGPERRDVTKSSTGAPVPTSFYDRLVEHLVVMGPMLDPNVVTIIQTNSGENLQIPRTSTYSAGSVTAEGATITNESDPTFGQFITLGAFKYAFLTQFSREMVEDSGINLLDFFARQAATGLGTTVNNALTIGTDTTQPNGIVTAAGSGVTGGTSVSGAFTADNLIDLVYSVNSPYRRRGAAFQMRASSLAAARKLKTSDGDYLWAPSLQVGQPDTLLGFPVLENPDIAATGTAVRSVIFGDMSAYHVRQVGGINIARSDEFAFSSDLITFRVTWRGDADLPDANAVKYFIGGTA